MCLKCSIGNATGDPANQEDLLSLSGKLQTPLIIGSGVTKTNIQQYLGHIQAAIIGSHFKKDGHWSNDLCEKSIGEFMHEIQKSR